VPAAGVVGEAMVMLTLAPFVLEKIGRRHDGRRAREPGRLPAQHRGRPEAPVAGGRATTGGDRASAATEPSRPGGTTRPVSAATTAREPWTSSSSACRQWQERGRQAPAHATVPTFVDLDERIERADGARSRRSSRPTARPPSDRWSGTRSSDLGPPVTASRCAGSLATGGGAWSIHATVALYRGRLTVWLDGRHRDPAPALAPSPHVRPLRPGRDRSGDARPRDRRSGSTPPRACAHPACTDVNHVVDLIEDQSARLGRTPSDGTRCSSTLDAIGRLSIGDGISASGVDRALRRLGRGSGGARVGAGPGRPSARASRRPPYPRVAVEVVELPNGEAASAWRSSRRRGRPAGGRRSSVGTLVAIGGGRLGDAAGSWRRRTCAGVPLIHVPTTTVAQIDSVDRRQDRGRPRGGQEPRRAFTSRRDRHRRRGARSLPERQSRVPPSARP
jgi:hypothetical protein